MTPVYVSMYGIKYKDEENTTQEIVVAEDSAYLAKQSAIESSSYLRKHPEKIISIERTADLPGGDSYELFHEDQFHYELGEWKDQIEGTTSPFFKNSSIEKHNKE